MGRKSKGTAGKRENRGNWPSDALDRSLNGVTTYYIYDGEKPILEYRSTAPSNPAKNVCGKGIDEILMRYDPTLTQDKTFYYQQDHEGSVTHLLKTSGTVIESYKYDAFGLPTIYDGDGNLLSSSARSNRFLFTGREYANLFGFYEYRARAYHPLLGRFMSEDPKLFDAGDYNFFRYCHNDPIDFTDPMGLAPREVDSEVDRVSVETLKRVLDISNRNLDGKGVGLERGKTIGPLNGRIQASDHTSVAHEGTPFKGPQKILYPDPPGGDNAKRDSFVHNHTNNRTTDSQGREDPKGTLTSPGDKKGGDKSDTTVYTISKDGKIIERYRQSDNLEQRKQNADSVTERLNNKGEWKVIEKKPAVELPGMQRQGK